MSAKRANKTPPPMQPEQFLRLKPKNIHLNFIPRNDNQIKLTHLFKDKDVIFVVGPSGVGKSYCLVTLALQALLYGEYEKIIISRPLVECGEHIGTLPGGVNDKTCEMNAPVIDILIDHLGQEIFDQFINDGKIKMIPLGFMRGRSLKNSIMILDEAQNATRMQTKMFLTRMDQNSKVLINGDITQCDLPFNKLSGLAHAIELLHNTEGVGLIKFNEAEVQRHIMVARIVAAYAKDQFSPPQILFAPSHKEETEVITDPRLPKSRKIHTNGKPGLLPT